MTAFLSTSPAVGTLVSPGVVSTMRLGNGPTVAQAGADAGALSQWAHVTRSSIARPPPSSPARSMPWIDIDTAKCLRWASGIGDCESVTLNRSGERGAGAGTPGFSALPAPAPLA